MKPIFALLVLVVAWLPNSQSSTWMRNDCAAGSSAPTSCGGLMDLLYAAIHGQTYSTQSLQQACDAGCDTDLIPGLASVLGSWNTSLTESTTATACGPNPSPRATLQLARSTRALMCLKPPGIPNGCALAVADALHAAGGLLDIFTSLQPLQLRGELLGRTCLALLPTGCCFRSWAYVMAALATQMCLPALALEYASLPGRCSAQGVCTDSWDTDLVPWLQDPPSCAAQASANQTVQLFSGQSCSISQLQQTQCPGTVCDLWCGVLGTMQVTEVKERELDQPSERKKGLSSNILAYVVTISVVFGLILLALLILALYYRAYHPWGSWRNEKQYTYAQTSASAAHVGLVVSNRQNPAISRLSAGGASGYQTARSSFSSSSAANLNMRLPPQLGAMLGGHAAQGLGGGLSAGGGPATRPPLPPGAAAARGLAVSSSVTGAGRWAAQPPLSTGGADTDGASQAMYSAEGTPMSGSVYEGSGGDGGTAGVGLRLMAGRSMATHSMTGGGSSRATPFYTPQGSFRSSERGSSTGLAQLVADRAHAQGAAVAESHQQPSTTSMFIDAQSTQGGNYLEAGAETPGLGIRAGSEAGAATSPVRGLLNALMRRLSSAHSTPVKH